LQPRPLDAFELGALPPDQRGQHQQCRAGAQPHQLPDRIGRDHEFSERITEREHEYRQQHQADAGQSRGALVIAGEFGEETHGWARRFLQFLTTGLLRPSTFLCRCFKDVDARDKPGHDELNELPQPDR
jgi:hypothetical protein